MHTCIPHEASQDPHDSMQSFQDQATKEDKSHHKPSPVRPIHRILHCRAASCWPAAFPFLRTLSYPLHAFHQAARFSKKVRYRVEEKIFVFKPHVSCSDVRSPQAVKAIRRDQQVSRQRMSTIMLRKKASWIPLQETPIVHRRLMVRHRTGQMEKRRGRKREKVKRKEKRR